MAQIDHRARHSRHPSRNSRLVNSNNTDSHVQHLRGKVESNEEESVNFIKRVLCSQTPQGGISKDPAVKDTSSLSLEELLPPLTSSNAVDTQLYVIIAVVLNQFVRSWYSRITSDNEFISEIVQIIAHCTRGIEQRLKHVDLEGLLLDELPALVVGHVETVIIAQDACASDRSPNDIRMIFHALRPNRALTPLPDTPANISEQQDNEIAWSQLLVTRILPLVLPPEDLQNPCLHVLVSEIFSEMIVHNAICGKGSEAWVIWEGVTKLVSSMLLRSNQRSADGTWPVNNRLGSFGLLSSEERWQREDLQKAQQRRRNSIAQVFWSVLHVLSIGFLFLRFLTKALMREASIPARSSHGGRTKTSNKLSVTAVAAESRPNPQQSLPDQHGDQRPVVSMRVWPCISKLTSLEYRMPWILGLLSLLQWLSLHGPGKLCRTDGALDRLMSSEIDKWLSRPDLLPRILLAIRGALFPDNALAPTRQTPTSAEITEIKRECAKVLVEAVPRSVRSRYFATKDMDLMRQDVESTLDLFADSYINKHLVVSALELLVVRLFPELGEDVVEE